MRILPFVKLSPCGNTTVLIRNAPLSPSERALAAAEMIAPGHLAAEQAGFVDTNRDFPRMDMMGGEFCLNASHALAVQLLREGRLHPLKTASGFGWHEGLASISGMDTPVFLRARRLDPTDALMGNHTENRFEASTLLDLPEKPEINMVKTGIWLVRLPGIAHLVLDAEQHPLSCRQSSSFEETTTQLFEHSGLMEEAAAGCIWLHRYNPDEPRITPFVRVRATNTTCAETACGSGTLAAAMICWLHTEPRTLALRQPGGEDLTVIPASSNHSEGWAVRVSGPVQVLAQGDVFVECLDGDSLYQDRRPPRSGGEALCLQSP